MKTFKQFISESMNIKNSVEYKLATYFVETYKPYDIISDGTKFIEKNLPENFDVEDVDLDEILEYCTEMIHNEFVDAFEDNMPSFYDKDKDCESSNPWCAPWETYDVEEYLNDMMSAEECGRLWAKKCKDEWLKEYNTYKD